MNHTVPDGREPAHHSQWDTLRIPVTVHQGAAAVIGWGPKECRKAFRSYTSWPLWPRPWPTMAQMCLNHHSWPPLITLDHHHVVQKCRIQPRTTPDHPEPPWTTLDHLGPPQTTLDHLELPETTPTTPDQPEPTEPSPTLIKTSH